MLKLIVLFYSVSLFAMTWGPITPVITSVKDVASEYGFTFRGIINKEKGIIAFSKEGQPFVAVKFIQEPGAYKIESISIILEHEKGLNKGQDLVRKIKEVSPGTAALPYTEAVDRAGVTIVLNQQSDQELLHILQAVFQSL